MGFLDLFKATENQQLKEQLQQAQSQNNELIQQVNRMQQQIETIKQQYQDSVKQLGELKASMPQEQKDLDAITQQLEAKHTEYTQLKADQELLALTMADTQQKKAAYDKTVSDTQKVKQLYEQYKAAVKGYEKNPDAILSDILPDDYLMPIVHVDLNCMNMRDLRKRYNQNQREIQKVFKRYEGRYTTKSNIAIYQLMVIAMEAELQNILSTLSFGKIEDAVGNVKSVTQRYYEVAVEGNQSIAPTMKSFIAEIEFLFIGTVKIEYEYYVKKEQAREEQRALREQMKQEAEERKALEIERRKIEHEESKFNTEIEQLIEKVEAASDETVLAQLRARIAELEGQRQQVQEKKAQIVNLQNGKAGHVYIISNLGSFGDDVFKIGMTRRFEPMDRIHELGNASVPFEFDVHSLIFSQDAPSLETALHKRFNQQRVNKVNLRKEFFRVPIDELEQAVLEFDPTAEFRRTMIAEQYYQSINRDEVVPEFDDISEENEDE